MSIFFTSDLHINHVNIMKYGRSEFFSSLDHMNRQLVERYRNVVTDSDTVFFLGDVVMGKRAESLEWIKELPGHKILVPGNHDNVHPIHSMKVRAKASEMYGAVFDIITHTEMHLNIAGEDVLLCHFPASGDHTEDERYPGYRPVHDGWIMHGHVHDERWNVLDKHIHVGVDADFTEFGVERFSPIPLHVIEEIITTT